ncbi:MAG: hypothetical protein JWM32_2573 [Verrucomicrobia bacterium]|nr:hypothetical protein [Verrucomicrobiota bacterium]
MIHSARPLLRRPLLCALIFSGATFVGSSALAADAGASLETLTARADVAIARPELLAYRGWIKFLLEEARATAAKDAGKGEAALAKQHRLDDWLQRIAADPALIASLRGVQEWAYESPVDGSGQPFKLVIPTDYDPAKPAPLSIYMHGSGGNHLEHSTAMVAHPGGFEMAVLGRGRDGGYRALSEADVLQALDYVEAHWAIDPNRIALRGGSMGGGGTYRLGSRYPQRWASGRPVCGFASAVPMGNLLTLPLYATHSADDPIVSVLHQRGPIMRLNEMGGQAILDETNGLGHFAWDYSAGTARAVAWLADKVRPDSRTVRHVDYTAIDGAAVRGWWAEIVEWGEAPASARFVLTAGSGNTLYATLTNLRGLKLLINEAPFDPHLPLQVSVNGERPITWPAPLPAEVVLRQSGSAWEFAARAPADPIRLHTPGSANLLYNGEPLLICYGTGGNAEEQAAMKAAAVAASHSCNASWPDGSGEAGPDGVPNSYNLYGQLPLRADHDLTDTEMENCHLVLIGTAAQNKIVARMSASLPVRWDEQGVACSDGTRLTGSDLALGLVYYNPLFPRRLIYWVAARTTATYAAGAVIPQVMSGIRNFGSNSFGADLLVMTGKATVLCARSFDSKWQWSKDRDASPVLDSTLSSSLGFSAALGRAICRASGADLALVLAANSSLGPVGVPGITRVSDLASFYANEPVGVMELAGTELLRMERLMAKHPEVPLVLSRIDAKPIEPDRRYQVALPVDVLWSFSALFNFAPSHYRLTEIDTAEAIGRYISPAR